jgi:hypothetical protein
MYDELIKDLRGISKNRAIPVCMAETAKDAADAIEDLSKQKWIPVTERLPELYVPCLVYNKSQPTMVGWRIDDKRFRIPGSYLPDHPTHWMPLPQPPKEE